MQAGAKITLRELKPSHQQRKKRGYRWLVESRIGGDRKRKFFKHGEKDKAVAYKEGLEQTLDKVSASHRKIISEALLTEAASASEALRPYDESISKAVAFYIEHLEKVASRDATSIDDVAEIAARVMKDKNATPRHIDKTRSKWTKLADFFDNAPLSSLTTLDLEKWIESFGFKSSTTRANYRTSLHSLFSVALSEEIIEKNVASKLPKYERRSCNGILTPGEVANLLACCDEEILPAVAICFFSGIRPDYTAGEISRLDWKDVKLAKRRIRLGADNTKTNEFRSVTITDNLAAWLEPYDKPSGPVVINESRFRRLWKEARSKGLKRTWPHDATRNSFASYHMELHGDEFKTATQTGHSDIKTLRDHYKDLIDDHEDAVAYFEIRPASSSDIIPISKIGQTA